MSPLCVPGTRRLLRLLLPGLPAAMHRRYTLDVSAPLLRTQGYVGGRWVSAASDFPVLDPATGSEIARVSDCGPAEAKRAVDAAYEAFDSWKRCTAKVRPLSSRTRTTDGLEPDLSSAPTESTWHLGVCVDTKRGVSLKLQHNYYVILCWFSWTFRLKVHFRN